MTIKKQTPSQDDGDAQVGTHTGVDETPQTGDAQQTLDGDADKTAEARRAGDERIQEQHGGYDAPVNDQDDADDGDTTN